MLLLTGCQSFFYFPRKEKLYDPARLNMQYEDVYIKTPSGESLHAWYFKSTTAEESKGTFLFFHGNAENLTSHFLMLHWLPAQGYNYLIFDYPGYGTSSGTATPEGTVEAGVAAANWIHQYKDTRPLIIYGQSLGGIVALKTAEEIRGTLPIRNVIIEASFSSYEKMSRVILRRHWFTWILQPITYLVISDKYAPKSLSGLSPIPLLFLCGTDDGIVELSNSEAMYAEAQEPKELWPIPGGRHGNLYEIRGGEVREQLLSYLSKTSTATK